MCGICMVLNTKDEYKDIAKKIFKSIVVDNEIRGTDSTGVLAIRRDKNYSLFKDTVKASVFMNKRKFKQEEADIWIGHTRLATTGEVSKRNAHPLERGGIILAHNGMISNYGDIAKEYGFTLQVDSEILLPIVEQEKWSDLIRLEGSFNFIAWDKNKNQILIEKHGNPLYLLQSEELGIIMMSSRETAIEFVKEHYDIKEEIIVYPENILSTMDMSGKMVDTTELVFPVERTLTYPYETAKKIRSYDGYYGGYRYDDDDWSEYESEYKSPTKPNVSGDENCICCGAELMQQEIDDSIAVCGYTTCGKCLDLYIEAQELIETEGYEYMEIYNTYKEIQPLLNLEYLDNI